MASNGRFKLSRHFALVTKDGWSPENLPNPKTNPADAGRHAVSGSNICDPDGILSQNSQDTLEGYIKRSDHETAVIIIAKMARAHCADSLTAADAAERFAIAIHDKWGVGGADSNDGVVLFLSVHDRVIHVSVGSGLTDRLNAAAITSIIDGMKSDLKNRDYGAGLEYAVLSIEDIIKNGRRTQSRSSNDSGLETKDIILAIIAMSLIVAFEKLRKHVRVKKAVELFPHVYESEDFSCPYCLETYDAKDKGKIKMACGHSFCQHCVKEMLLVAGKEVGTCVICAEPLKLPVPQEEILAGAVESCTESSYDFRLKRFFEIYDDVAKIIDLDALVKAELAKYDLGTDDAQKLVENRLRDIRIRREMKSAESRKIARDSGSKGSSTSSFGGGSSNNGGGGGGTW